MSKIKLLVLIMAITVLAACAPSVPSDQSVQTAISQTQAGWTPISTQTPYPTHTPYPTQTKAIQTVVMVQTPTNEFSDNTCKPIGTMDYVNYSNIALYLQTYVASRPDVKSVSYVIKECELWAK